MKTTYRIILILFFLFLTSIIYLSFVGVETDKFNKQISNKINDLNQGINIELNKIKLVLDPLNFNFDIKTLGPKIKSRNQEVELESIKTQVSLYSIIKNDFSVKKIEISTKSLEVKKVLSFIRSINRSSKLLILETLIRKGYLIADIKLEFDENGNIKDNYDIDGFVKDGKIALFDKHRLEKINFIFKLENNKTFIKDLRFKYNDLNLQISKLNSKNTNSGILFNGEFNNKNLVLDDKIINNFFKNKNLKIKNIDFNSNSQFSFKLDKKFKLRDFKLKSKIELNQANILNTLDIKDIFPKIKEQIELSNHVLQLDYYKDDFQLKGKGNILIQNKKDFINYSLDKKGEKFNFETLIKIKDNPLFINFLNFQKNENSELNIKLKGSNKKNIETKIDYFHIEDKKNQILFNDIFLDKNNKLIKLKKAKLKYLDIEDQKNDIEIINDKKDYILSGRIFNANKLIDDLIVSEDETDFDFFKKNKFNIKINLDKVRLDKNYSIKGLNGNLKFVNSNLVNANLSGMYSNDQKIKFTVNSNDNEKVTTFYSDHASPFIQRFNFIKGFDEGSLDFNSSKIANKTNSNLKIYDFKIKEVPVLTKLLTLASLQGIADLLSGEGIRFNEFEMKFINSGSLTTIEELYGLGPAISILMEGYIEKNKLVSLRGTLVPATTINKVISSIPLVGEILVGSKTGEGVFGVSFKIKGPPKKLETTVNPIKTLTPRFITRTLEKLKKN